MKFEVPHWIENDAWDGFCEMRKAIRKPLTERAKHLILKTLMRLDPTGKHHSDMLDQSTMNSWQGVFMLRDLGQYQQQRKTQVRETDFLQ